MPPARRSTSRCHPACPPTPPQSRSPSRSPSRPAPASSRCSRPARSAPPTSTINADGRGQTRAAGAIVGRHRAGLDVFSYAGGHVIVDVTGWFTGATAPVDDDGLFVPEHAPRRLIDTRNGDPIWAGGGVEIATSARTRRRWRSTSRSSTRSGPAFLTAHPARQAAAADEHRQRRVEQRHRGGDGDRAHLAGRRRCLLQRRRRRGGRSVRMVRRHPRARRRCPHRPTSARPTAPRTTDPAGSQQLLPTTARP